MSGDWGIGLPWLLLAEFEVVQESTGFTPRELVFGQKVDGALVDLQNGRLPEEALQSLADYVKEFGLKLYRAGKLTKQKLQIVQGKVKKASWPGWRVTSLVQAILLTSPLQAKYCDSQQFTVLTNFILITGCRKFVKLCHVCLLKAFCSHYLVEPDLQNVKLARGWVSAWWGVVAGKFEKLSEDDSMFLDPSWFRFDTQSSTAELLGMLSLTLSGLLYYIFEEVKEAAGVRSPAYAGQRRCRAACIQLGLPPNEEVGF